MPFGRALALLAVCFTVPGWAQRYGQVFGRVLDVSEGGIGDASVAVVNEDSGFRRVTQTEPTGSYAVGALEPGTYKITVRKDGFRSVMRFGVRILSSAATRADFLLPVGSVEETITVMGTAPLMRHDDASTAGSAGRNEIEKLPLNGRGLLSLMEMTPGTNIIPATRGEAGQFTVTGQRPNTNYFTVDGASANTGVSAGGLPAQSTGGSLPALSAFGSMDSLISLDAMQEMHLTTSTSVAEFGRLPGAMVALTSRSGTNAFHGSTAYRIRNESFSANDWFANQSGYGRLPLRLQDFTQTAGGPLKRDHSFLFLSFQRVALLQPFVWLQPVPSLVARQSAADWAQPLLSLFPTPTGGPLASGVGEWLGRGKRPASLNTGGARFDQAIGTRVSLFARYNDSPSSNQFGTLAVNQLDLRSQSLTLGLNTRITPNTILDLRSNESQVTADSQWNPGQACALQPVIDFFYNAPTPCDTLVRFSIGGLGQLVSGREGLRRQRQFQLVGTASLHRRSHTFGLGADFRTIVAIRRDPTGNLGVIADDLLALSDKRNLWIATATGQNGSADVEEVSLWLQDTWQATSRLTIAAGLRWEFSLPPISSDKTNFLDLETNTVFTGKHQLWQESYRDFAPRAGVAWLLTRDGRTVLRAGGGLYYDSSMSIATDILNGGPLSVSRLSSGIHAPFPASLDYGFMPDLQLPEVAQWNIAVERALGPHDLLSLGYVGSAGWNLLRREAGGAGSSANSLVALTTNHGHSNYHGLQAQYRRRLTTGLEATAAYTWSHSIDNDSSDAFLLWAAPGPSDRGASDFDVRHSLNASATYDPKFLKGWAVDGIFRARTGFPITILQAEEYQGISLMNAFRPDLVYGHPLWLADPGSPGSRRLNPAAFAPTAIGNQGTLGRNALGGFGTSQIDLAVRREFRFTERLRLTLRIEAFNALNQASFADPIRYLNSPVFGQATSMLNLMLGTGSPGSGLAPILQTGGPRSLQAAVKFQF
jgi:hypothetical protein